MTDNDLYSRLRWAIRSKCWRTACARIRDIAKMREREDGVPYEDTLRLLEYEKYRNNIAGYNK